MFEQLLEGVHPEVTIPYWDWTKAGEESVPGWLAAFTPTVPTPTGSIAVTRAPGSSSWLATIASNVPATLAVADYTSFATQIEDIHNLVHGWVGGTMGGIATRPPTQCSGCTTRTSIASGGSGSGAPRAPGRIPA